MKKSIHYLFIILLLGSVALFNSCDDSVAEDDFGIFNLTETNTITMNGVIGSKTPQHWDNIVRTYPSINRIIMENCPGSEDDEANLEVARKIRTQDVDIHLPANAEIASGAVDLFLSGTGRTRMPGSKIGVHSWADGDGSEATDYPVGSAEHLPYINYYVDMGFSQEDAEAFYYFTINAATANNIHWMTDEEISTYKLLTP